MSSFNLETWELISLVQVDSSVWWSCMPPVVYGEGVYLGVPKSNGMLVRFNFEMGQVVVIGKLK